MRRFIKRILPVVLLVLLDQAIKIYIAKNFMEKEFNIIGNIVGFQPYQNIDYSWINSITDLGISFTAHIILNTIVLIFAFLIYDFVKTKHQLSILEHSLFTFLFSGIACSIIDKVAWGGSLDYILLRGLFIFDLKDVYLSVFDALIILCLIINHKNIRSINERSLMKQFAAHIKKKYLIKFCKSVHRKKV